MKGWKVAVDFVTGGQVVKGVGQEGGVYGQGQSFNGDEGVAQRSAKGVGVFELGSPGGTELFVAEGWTLCFQESKGRRGQGVAVIIEKADQEVPVDTREEGWLGKQVQHKAVNGMVE